MILTSALRRRAVAGTLVVGCFMMLSELAAAQSAPTLRIVATATPAGSSAPTVSIPLETPAVFTVDVRVDNPLAQGVFAWTLGVTHDPAKLSVLSVSQDLSSYSNLPVGFPVALGEIFVIDETSPGVDPTPGVGISQILQLQESFFFDPMSEGVICTIEYEVVSLDPGESTTIEFSEMIANLPSPPVIVSTAVTGGVVFEDTDMTLENLSVTGSFESTFIRGSCSGSNGPLALSDAISLLEFLFGGVAVPCADACDFDDSGVVSFIDALSLLRFLFAGADGPPAPNGTCAVDPTTDTTDCLATPINCP